MEKVASYINSRQLLLKNRKEFVKWQLKSKKRVFVTLFTSIVIGAIGAYFLEAELSFNEFSSKSSAVGYTIVTWFIQFPVFVVLVYLWLWYMQKNMSVSLLKKAIKNTPDNFFGEVNIYRSDDNEVIIKSPKNELSVSEEDDFQIVNTPSACHIATNTGICLASIPNGSSMLSAPELIQKLSISNKRK